MEEWTPLNPLAPDRASPRLNGAIIHSCLGVKVVESRKRRAGVTHVGRIAFGAFLAEDYVAMFWNDFCYLKTGGGPSAAEAPT
jgi:hypothetical protein